MKIEYIRTHSQTKGAQDSLKLTSQEPLEREDLERLERWLSEGQQLVEIMDGYATAPPIVTEWEWEDEKAKRIMGKIDDYYHDDVRELVKHALSWFVIERNSQVRGENRDEQN